VNAADARITLARYGPLAACAAVLVWHSLQYRFVTDDAFISFVYSRNLAEHGELVFNQGMDPVEGYTNFLWTILLGLLMVVGLLPEITSLVLGTGFAIGTLVVVHRTSAHIWRGRSAWDLVAPALLALSAGFACWSSGGLETQMFTFWVALAIHFYLTGDEDGRALRRVGWALALAAMTRPEGLLVAGIIGVHRVIVMLVRERRVRPSRDELLCLGWFLVVWVPWFAWRWWYYGYPFPNTYYVKAAGPASAAYHAEMREVGLHYVAQFLRHSGLLYAAPLALVGLLVARPWSRRFLFGSLGAAMTLAYLYYTVGVGGDFMGLHRFVMPLFPIGALAVAGGLRLATRLVHRQRVIAVAAALALLGAHGAYQIRLTWESMRWGNFKSDRGIDTPAYLRVYAHDRALIGEHMRPCFREDDFAIFGGAGAKPYYARVRGIDVYGLVSERIGHDEPRKNPRPGHNKWGSDRLLLEHDPTFVFSCYSIHSDPKRPRWNCPPGPWQARGYQPVTLRIEGLLEKGEYYTFLVKRDRAFDCAGRVK
jgi:arabinofuranosyltransferase